jgi:nucleoside-diphosphate-sugar epimerase
VDVARLQCQRDAAPAHHLNGSARAAHRLLEFEFGVRRHGGAAQKSSSPSRCRARRTRPRSSREQYVLAFARAGQVEGVALRYFNVFGPRQDPNSPYAAVIPAFLSAAFQGGAAVMFGDGQQTRDFTYVANVVEANILAAAAPAGVANGTVVNVGGGQRTSLLRLLEVIRDVTGRGLACTHQPRRGGDVRDSMAGLERARQVIGYHPGVTLEEGLRRTWGWFVDAHRPAAAFQRAAAVA